jgi:DNA repair protein RadC
VKKAKEQLQPEYEQQAFEWSALQQPPRRLYTTTEIAALHRALEPFIDLAQLRQFAAEHHALHEALRSERPPQEVRAIVETLVAVLRPVQREKIRSPHDVAAFLMVEMGTLDQEEMRTVLLDTKNNVQEVVTVYRGSLNAAMIRVGEIFKAAVRRNSAALILAHNHPSGEPDPSPEDVLVTREIVSAGKLLDIEVLDHLVIGQGRWISLRERGIGFSG